MEFDTELPEFCTGAGEEIPPFEEDVAEVATEPEALPQADNPITAVIDNISKEIFLFTACEYQPFCNHIYLKISKIDYFYILSNKKALSNKQSVCM